MCNPCDQWSPPSNLEGVSDWDQLGTAVCVTSGLCCWIWKVQVVGISLGWGTICGRTGWTNQDVRIFPPHFVLFLSFHMVNEFSVIGFGRCKWWGTTWGHDLWEGSIGQSERRYSSSFVSFRSFLSCGKWILKIGAPRELTVFYTRIFLVLSFLAIPFCFSYDSSTEEEI